MLTGSAILLIISSTLAILIASLVAIAHTVRPRIKIAFTAVLLNLCFWQGTIYIADVVSTNKLFWNHLVFLWPTLAAISFLVFITYIGVYYAPRSMIHNKVSTFFRVSLWLALLLQLAAIVSGNIFSTVTYNSFLGQHVFTRGAAYPLYLIGFAIMLTLILLKFFSQFRSHKKDIQENRAFKTINITVIVAATYGVITNVLLPNMLDDQKYINLGLLTVDILAVGFSLSIVRYQFLDIRPYIFRSLGYILALLSLAISYVLVGSLLSGYLFDLRPGTIFVLTLISLIVAVSFKPLLDRFNHLTNKLFFRDYYDAQEVLDNLVSLLVRTVDIEVIRNGVDELIAQAIKPTSFSLILKKDRPHRHRELLQFVEQTPSLVIDLYELEQSGRDHYIVKFMKKEDIALIVKLRTKEEVVGCLLLGLRRSGAGYSHSDQKFLTLVADQLAIGLQNALRFKEIEAFNETLQEKIDTATKKLRSTNDKLRQLDQTKDDFISMASHQLRTPLTSVKGYVSMVLEGDAGEINDLQRKLLNQSYISSQRMVYLISDLLNVSRLRTGKFLIEATACNLNKVIHDEIEQLRETAKGRNLELSYEMPKQFPALLLDETKIRQVIMNFIDNAIYYTPSGGHILVKLTESKESITFTVTDDGIGVPRHEQPHLFSKFYRANNAKRARPDGTGLGLFMAKKVVVAQGGAIIFKSQEGKGSTFGFTFAKAPLMPSNPVNAPPRVLQK